MSTEASLELDQIKTELEALLVDATAQQHRNRSLLVHENRIYRALDDASQGEALRDLEGVMKQAKPTAKALLEQGLLEGYLEEHPQSSRRIQAEVKGVALLSGEFKA